MINIKIINHKEIPEYVRSIIIIIAFFLSGLFIMLFWNDILIGVIGLSIGAITYGQGLLVELMFDSMKTIHIKHHLSEDLTAWLENTEILSNKEDKKDENQHRIN
jgi:hypothetical protein